MLTGVSSNGARILLDRLVFGPQRADVAQARLGCGGAWWNLEPTPGGGNVAGSWVGKVGDAGASFTLAFPTETNRTYQVDYADDLSMPAWTPLPPISGDGIEKAITQPMVTRRFYRIRAEAQ